MESDGKVGITTETENIWIRDPSSRIRVETDNEHVDMMEDEGKTGIFKTGLLQFRIESPVEKYFYRDWS